MIRNLIACVTLAASHVVAQESRTISARIAFFHDTKENPAELFYRGAAGDFVRVVPTSGVGGEGVKMVVGPGGQVSLFPTKDGGKSLATAKVPAGLSEAIFFLLKVPAATAEQPSYRVLVADESMKTLPRGGSFVCNIGAFEARVALGETKHSISPGKSAHVKRPEQRDAYNMAAFQIETRHGGVWKPLKDTMIRFSENERYFFLIYSAADGGPAVKIYKQFVPLKANEAR